jgi:hypothetical protein
MGDAFYDSESFNGASDNYYIFNGSVRVSTAKREACPVCGHPTSDCTGESGPPKTIFGFNTNSTLDESLPVLVESDYYETYEIAPGLVTKRIVHKKGTSITFARAKEIGLIP